MKKAIIMLGFLAISAFGMSGCWAAALVGGMAQNMEYQKELQILPQYAGLENKTVAVVVDADYSILYRHQNLIRAVNQGITGHIGRNVPGVKMVHHDIIQRWQYQRPQWNAMPYGELAKELNVDRVVYVEIHEYRLNPPGNYYMWEGVCSANVGIIEADGFDADMFVDVFTVVAEFPKVRNLPREGATSRDMETGLLSEFVKQAAWLFYEHLEPKYPDKFQHQAA